MFGILLTIIEIAIVIAFAIQVYRTAVDTGRNAGF